MPSELVILILIAISIAATVLNTIAGGGSGIILVPVLTLLFSFSPSNAVGTTFLAGMAGAVFSMLSYSRQQIVDYKVGTALGLVAIPGVAVGSVLTGQIPVSLFSPILGFIVIALALLMFFQREAKVKDRESESDPSSLNGGRPYAVKLRYALPLIIMTGVFAGTFGAGGGLVLTPVLLLAGLPIFFAVGTNRLVALIYIIGVVVFKSYLGQVDFDFGPWLVIGARVVKLQNTATLKKLVAFIILVLGLSVIIEAVF